MWVGHGCVKWVEQIILCRFVGVGSSSNYKLDRDRSLQYWYFSGQYNITGISEPVVSKVKKGEAGHGRPHHRASYTTTTVTVILQSIIVDYLILYTII